MNFISVISLLLTTSAILFMFTVMVTSDCTDPKDVSTRSLAGGIKKASKYSPEVKQTAVKLQNKINAQSQPTCQVQVKQILNGSTQVVAGTQIRLAMKLCPRGDGCNTNKCKICSARVYKDLSGSFDVKCFMCDGVK